MNLFQPLPEIEMVSPVKAFGLDVESTQTSLLEGGGPPAGGGRSKRAPLGLGD